MSFIGRVEPDWSGQQRLALERIERWGASDDPRTFYLAGYAGTGKTTLARHAAALLGDNVVFGAFTGKAASVMREKGCDGADTIDSLIYRARREAYCADKPPCTTLCMERCRHRRERLIGKSLNEQSVVAEADLVVIDEVSMVDAAMGGDLESFGAPILVLGDPAQLPPVGGEGHFTARDPHFLLTEIHRQAAESPIISMATNARNGLRTGYGARGGSAVVPRIDPAEMVGFDQIITGKNVTRQTVNKQVRKLLGFADPLPMVGDKVVCLKNNRRLGLRNGTLWRVIEAAPEIAGFVEMVVENEIGDVAAVTSPVDGFISITGDGSNLPGDPFAFGYAITCHKAQGSQWRSVLVFDESGCFREHSWRWLYTAITRASDRVTVVRGGGR